MTAPLEFQQEEEEASDPTGEGAEGGEGGEVVEGEAASEFPSLIEFLVEAGRHRIKGPWWIAGVNKPRGGQYRWYGTKLEEGGEEAKPIQGFVRLAEGAQPLPTPSNPGALMRLGLVRLTKENLILAWKMPPARLHRWIVAMADDKGEPGPVRYEINAPAGAVEAEREQAERQAGQGAGPARGVVPAPAVTAPGPVQTEPPIDPLRKAYETMGHAQSVGGADEKDRTIAILSATIVAQRQQQQGESGIIAGLYNQSAERMKGEVVRANEEAERLRETIDSKDDKLDMAMRDLRREIEKSAGLEKKNQWPLLLRDMWGQTIGVFKDAMATEDGREGILERLDKVLEIWAPRVDIVELGRKLMELKNIGLLNDAELQAAKVKLLSSMGDIKLRLK